MTSDLHAGLWSAFVRRAAWTGNGLLVALFLPMATGAQADARDVQQAASPEVAVVLQEQDATEGKAPAISRRPLRLARTLPSTAPAAQASATAIDVSTGPEWARVSLRWPSAVTTVSRRLGTDLWLRFDQPLEVTAVSSLQARLPGWLREVRFGFDTLLLSPEGPVEFHVDTQGSSVVIEMRRGTAADETGPDTDNAQRRIRRLAARARAERGDLVGARASLRRLVAEDPADIESISALADLESRLGRWQQAVTLYSRALATGPEQPDLIREKARLLHAHGTRVRVAWDLLEVKEGDRQVQVRTELRMPLGQHAVLGARYEQRRVEHDGVQRATGLVAPVGITRRRADVYLRFPQGTRGTTELGLLIGPQAPGFAGDYTLYGNYGATRLGLELNRPYWELLEGLVDDGTRSRVSFAHDGQIGEHTYWSAQASLNRYGLDGDPNVARSWALEGDIHYQVTGPDPALGISYQLDTERVLHRERRLNPAGETFRVLPLVSREVHVLEGTWSMSLTDYLRLDAAGGYGYDRLNAHGPLYRVALRYEPLADLEIGVHWHSSLTSGRGGADELSQLGAYVALRGW